uniref:MFS domain-containing protein n=1 Tax=Rhabditophanes sp. KR3021 TaxID=114890 RepID=A0AC35TZR0_9BILA
MFMVSLDSVADNILPAAMPYLKRVFKSKKSAIAYWEHIVSSRIYGVAIGCIITIILSNKCGRKKPLIWATVMCFVGALLSGFVIYPRTGLWVAVLGRFINGIGSGISQVIGSVMIAEIPSKESRGTVLATLTVWACVGELFGMTISLDTFFGTKLHWHYALFFPALILPIAVIFLIRAPDSPRYLMEIGDIANAKISISYYQCQDFEHYDYEDELEKLINIENGNKSFEMASIYNHLRTRFSSTVFIRPLIVATFVQSFVHLDDWMWIYYSTNVFQTVGLNSNSAMRASVYMSIPQAAISIALLFFFESFSRKLLLIIPTIFSVIFSSIAIIGLQSSTGLLSHQNMWLIMPLVATADLCVAAVASESAYTIVPELFSQKDRVLGTAFVGIIQNLFGGFLSSMLLTTLSKHGVEYVLGPFLLMNILYIIVVQKIVPETCNATFQEISTYFKTTSYFNFGFKDVLKFLQFKGLKGISKKGRFASLIIIALQIIIYLLIIHFFLTILRMFI